MSKSIEEILEGMPKTAKDITEDARGRSTVVVESSEPAPVQVPVNPSDHSMDKWVSRPDAHPIALDVLYLKRFGPDFLSWAPETVQTRGIAEFGTLSNSSAQKLLACKTLHLVDTYWLRWESFVWCTMGFFGTPPDLDVMQVPTPAQAVLSLSYARRIRSDVEWSTELKNFLRELLTFQGIFYPPDILAFAQPDLAAYGVPPMNARLEDGELREKQQEQLRRRKVLEDLLLGDHTLLKTQLAQVEYV